MSSKFDEISQPENGSAVPLLQNMANPVDFRFAVAPGVGTDGGNAILTSQSTTLQYEVKATPATAPLPQASGYGYTDVVPFHTGMYMCLPRESIESIYNYGIVGAGSYSDVPSLLITSGYPVAATARGFDIRGVYFGERGNGASISTTTFYNGVHFDFGQCELALPRVGDNAGFEMEPDASKSFSKIHPFAQMMTMSCTTVSGINFNMTGTLHSGVLADTRDACQVIGTNGSARAYPSAALIAQSINSMDVIKAVPVSKGFMQCTGPDYPKLWSSPDHDKVDSLNSEWNTYQVAKFKSTPISASSITAIKDAGAVNFQTCWITPYDTNMWITCASSQYFADPASWQRVTGAMLNETGMYDIDYGVAITATCSNTNNQGNGTTFRVSCNFIHVFAHIQDDGLVHYVLKDETTKHTLFAYDNIIAEGIATTIINPTGATAITRQPKFSFKARPRLLRTGFATTSGGKYLGTLLTASVSIGNGVGADNWTVTVANPSLSLRCRSIMNEGRLGPAHIVRYDGLAEGQQVQFDGVTLFQAIPLGKLAPFVSSTAPILTVPDSLFSKFVDVLWSQVPQFRRISTLADFNQRIRPWIANLSLPKLLDAIDRMDPTTRDIVRAMGTATGGATFWQTAGRNLIQSIAPGIGQFVAKQVQDIGSSFGGRIRQREEIDKPAETPQSYRGKG